MAPIVLSWSGGKDAAYTLYTLREQGKSVTELLTTINEEYDRSSIHGVHRALYERQAAAIGLPINCVSLPPEPSNEEYEARFEAEMHDYAERGIERVAFGDLFLEDVRDYRETQLAACPVDGTWPVWGRDTTALIEDWLALGFRATVVAVDDAALDASFAGRELDDAFIDDLPDGVDPCGEHGEFHTFVWDGPIFEEAVDVETGETVTRSVGEAEIHYSDLRLAEEA
ncbi:adenine nucleotide alpha hydrolase [Halobacteria archaeon AArc-dxtr1]|nr:adenine nucleotide alpha hydrolase [Halobacteria archaeon AArc-dxtr1]